jgi:hypothetical protein
MSDNVFQVWILRSDTTERPFSLRFETSQGRGMFMLPQSGVTAAPPASTDDEVSKLSAKEILSVRYIQISTNPHKKSTWATNSIEIDSLLQLPAGRWVELLCGSSGTLRIPDLAPSIELHHADNRRSTAWQPSIKTPSNRPAPQHKGQPPIPQPKSSNKQTATERILDLEAKVSESNQRVAQLKRRVAALERDVEALGGTVQPWELEPRKQHPAKNES